ncbi:MAG: DegT/DnrJ/EryC1/StrS family aminotransferase [Candidatus Neomarinimicrobiota bacterium]|nr:MAG: DegT/DnrJ/EryC1/StrS family aminotransferase [Candidatus Neomarinimicrobiota bacterium]
MTQDLALFGGVPVRKKPFPVWPRYTHAIRHSVEQTLAEDQWGIGSQTIERFEKAFARFQDADHCLAINSGTSALWVALKAAGVQAGDEVIIPPYTFIATGAAVLMANAVPVFVDVEEDTFNLDPGLLEAAITDKTRAIVPVHIGGNPAHLDRILAVAEKHGLPVVEDAAQAHGAEWKGTRVGALGIGGIFSFQSSKNMSAGEGGAIVSNDAAFMDACYSYYNCGRVPGGDWYEHHRLGGNFRMTSVAAAMLLPQLETIEQEMALREQHRARLDAWVESLPGLSPLRTYPEVTRSANHLYLFRYHSDQFQGIPRDVFLRAMQAEGIFTYVGYTPLYRERLFIVNTREYPWLKGRHYSNVQLPVCERIATEEAVWLKQNVLLGSEEDVRDIQRALEKVTTAMRSDPGRFLSLTEA